MDLWVSIQRVVACLVEQLTNHPKLKGLNPTVKGTVRNLGEIMKSRACSKKQFLTNVSQQVHTWVDLKNMVPILMPVYDFPF